MNVNINSQLDGSLMQHLLGQQVSIMQKAVLVASGVALLWLSAKVEIPFYPVPMTMQTFVVLMIGMAYGVRTGSLTVISYLALGVVGLPVFAGTPEKGIGLAYMVGPTGGYLLGFVLAATVCGWLAERLNWGRSVLTAVMAMLLGNAVIYMTGLLWLGTVVGWDKPVLTWGFTPFVLGDLLKIALAAATLPLAWKFLKNDNPDNT